MIDDYVDIYIANCNDVQVLFEIMQNTLDRLELIAEYVEQKE
jgi:hypothetical protein